VSVCLHELSDGLWCVTSYELVVVELPQGGLERCCCKVTAERKLRRLNWFLAPLKMS
jgi:hypothetical protein